MVLSCGADILSRMSDYERIAASIRQLQTSFREQPSLEELASAADLSPHHFQRVFQRWAGVSPKKFLQCLTVQAARPRLQDGASVLEAALDAGLSGPGRLHDLTVRLEAASPGEIKSGGRGWTIRWGFAESPFGVCLIASGQRGLLRLSFVDQPDDASALAILQTDWPAATLQRDPAHAASIVQTMFAAKPPEAPSLRCVVRGTEFQVLVWRALLEVRPGQLTTYSQIARRIDRPAAVRAVGTAVGRNPIACLIPCHRVIRSTGVIGEYRWGSPRKRLLVATELMRSS